MNRVAATRSTSALLAAVLAIAGLGVAQVSTGAHSVGTVASIRPEAGEIEVRADGGATAKVKLDERTLLQRVAPGEKDLQEAEAIGLAQIAPGDRVLVTIAPGATAARRVVVMAAAAIAQRNDADRQDWEKRGVFGVVEAKSEGEITLRLRSASGETEARVIVGAGARYRRYAPDSVRFADARPSSLAEVSSGDQLRARGTKSADGLTVTVEEVVFGTFITTAGTVTSVDAGGAAIHIKDLGTGTDLVVALTRDSQVKKLPDFGAMPQAEPVGLSDRRPGPTATPSNGVRNAPERLRAGITPVARPDFSRSLEQMPAANVEDLKPGETVVISSTRGASDDRLTAITIVGNAGALLRMAGASTRLF
ncbi:MAG: hypothetical protein KIT09_25015 [Bryobacteraceae bacterium]|nr:hypothetical protein [Bryobacteraceae bacterium]